MSMRDETGEKGEREKNRTGEAVELNASFPSCNAHVDWTKSQGSKIFWEGVNSSL